MKYFCSTLIHLTEKWVTAPKLSQQFSERSLYQLKPMILRLCWRSECVFELCRLWGGRGGVIATITGYTPSQPHSDLRISLFHIQLITARRPSSSLINRDAEHKHILSSPSGCRWRRLVLIPISHQLPLITHSGIHHHGNYCTCYGWLSRQPGWIIVPVLLWCAASPPLAWLTRSCDVKITARNACCG